MGRKKSEHMAECSVTALGQEVPIIHIPEEYRRAAAESIREALSRLRSDVAGLWGIYITCKKMVRAGFPRHIIKNLYVKAAQPVIQKLNDDIDFLRNMLLDYNAQKSDVDRWIRKFSRTVEVAQRTGKWEKPFAYLEAAWHTITESLL